jgi:hypothetical protein
MKRILTAMLGMIALGALVWSVSIREQGETPSPDSVAWSNAVYDVRQDELELLVRGHRGCRANAVEKAEIIVEVRCKRECADRCAEIVGVPISAPLGDRRVVDAADGQDRTTCTAPLVPSGRRCAQPSPPLGLRGEIADPSP